MDRIDVLAVMDGLADYAEMANEDADVALRIRAARAAVADLIEAAEIATIHPQYQHLDGHVLDVVLLPMATFKRLQSALAKVQP